jgi:hypothetical protein
VRWRATLNGVQPREAPTPYTRFTEQDVRQDADQRQGEDHGNPGEACSRLAMAAQQHSDQDGDLQHDDGHRE